MLPVIETERLVLRPRVMADLDACFAMNCEPGTLDYIDFPRDGDWSDLQRHRAFLEETFGHLYPEGLGYWSVAPREDPSGFLGWVLMAPEDLKGPEVEIGWRLLTAARGQGFATEAARAMVAHGFEQLDLPCVIADMYRANAGSMGVARKLGMRQRADPDRTTDDYVLWELTCDMWAAQNS